MATFIKSKLKTARDALGKKDYPAARAAASQVLEYEAGNYNANVFLGLACLELGDVEAAEKAYRSAIETSPDQALAWQGLAKLYEKTEQLDKYGEVLERLLEVFDKSADAPRLAESLQRLIDLRRAGPRPALIHALSRVLPSAPHSLFPTLSTLPPPQPSAPLASPAHAIQLAVQNSLPVLEEVVDLTERDEEERVRREVERRRTRLGAGTVEQIRRDVVREVGEGSQLSTLYEEILNHPYTPDALRRSTEAKLLRYKLSQLTALPIATATAGGQQPQPAKDALRTEVREMARGAVLLDIPDELAWTIWAEWRDVEYLEGYDYAFLRRFRGTFPHSALSRVIRGYMQYMGIPLSVDDDESEAEADGPADPDDDLEPYDLLLEAAESTPESIMSQRMLAEAQRREEDWAALVRTAESGLARVGRHELETGQKLSLTTKSLNTELATALVHLHPPKHHVRALRLLDSVLAHDPGSVPCLMGRGYVLQQQQKWGEAAILFGKVVQLERARRAQGVAGAQRKAHEEVDGDDGVDGTELEQASVVEMEAREERAWCWVRNGLAERGEQGLRDVVALWDQFSPQGREDVSRQRARGWWRLGRCLWEFGGRYEEAYKCFIASLKRLSTFAPSFTSLGLYYIDILSPPDPSRASKCFQKAFELDAREGEAARRLAEGFADEGEWDLTEVVARRTIEGEGGLDAAQPTTAAAARRYLPQNAWAWKALGAVELHRRAYALSIQAFQIALRADQADAQSWLRLGEAYARSGRHVAAIKALTRAQELNPDDWVCAFIMAQVECEIGQFDSAIGVLEDIAQKRPDDAGVQDALAGTYLALGRSQVEGGFLGRAEGSFWRAVEVARELIGGESNFRRLGWKTLCDALYELATSTTFEDPDDAYGILGDLELLLARNEGSKGGIVGSLIPASGLAKALGQGADGLVALKLSLLGCEHRVALTQYDGTGVSSAWYDLAIGLRRLASLLPATEDQEPYLKESLRCVKEAVRADPKDPAYWNALGVMSFEKSPRLAQHAFLSAIQIDSKDPVVWTNLGLLYLFHEDAELANQALLRAQTLDPDQPLAWVGQALLAAHNGDEADASALFEHAVIISSGAMLEASHVFAARLLNARETHKSQVRTDRLFLAFSSLDRYCRERPTSSTVLHLHGLICEQLGQRDLAEQRVNEAITLLEREYETSEDKAIERHYTVAHGNLGRLLLANNKPEQALESFSTVINLLPPEVDAADRDTVILRALAGIGSGLAYFLQDDLEHGLAALEAASEQIPSTELEIKGHVTLTLAKMLWALGSEEARETAKSLLLECISADSRNLSAITALASIGSLTDDGDLVTAALAEIDTLPPAERVSVDPSGEVEFLLSSHHLANGDIQLAIGVAEEGLEAQPGSLHARQSLAQLLLMSGNPLSARHVLPSQGLPGDAASRRLSALIRLALKEKGEPENVPVQDEIEVEGILKMGVTPMDDAQRAVVAAPWESPNWATIVVSGERNEA